MTVVHVRHVAINLLRQMYIDLVFPVRARAKTSGFGGYRIPPGAGTGIFSRQTIAAQR